MVDYRDMEQRLSEILGLQRRRVAVTFLDTPPGVAIYITSAVGHPLDPVDTWDYA